ncbi:MAG: sigma-70 family RNA polymerase sigma factor [Planctomycetia bacterium]|nr:sigma-70 family RNA polymerase sigma factor [Planctomycetia bacterium]
MPDPKEEAENLWSNDFWKYQDRLMILAARNLHPMLRRRFSVEDVVQDALMAACKRKEFFLNCPEIPVYIKLRTILLQTITDHERKHLQSKKRDAYKERDFSPPEAGSTSAEVYWEQFAESITSPLSRLVREDRHALLRNVLEALPENDRQILTLRHFDGMSNQECAEVLEIEPKTASIRYVRALQRLKNKLTELSEFRL